MTGERKPHVCRLLGANGLKLTPGAVDRVFRAPRLTIPERHKPRLAAHLDGLTANLVRVIYDDAKLPPKEDVEAAKEGLEAFIALLDKYPLLPIPRAPRVELDDARAWLAGAWEELAGRGSGNPGKRFQREAASALGYLFGYIFGTEKLTPGGKALTAFVQQYGTESRAALDAADYDSPEERAALMQAWDLPQEPGAVRKMFERHRLDITLLVLEEHASSGKTGSNFRH